MASVSRVKMAHCLLSHRVAIRALLEAGIIKVSTRVCYGVQAHRRAPQTTASQRGRKDNGPDNEGTTDVFLRTFESLRSYVRTGTMS